MYRDIPLKNKGLDTHLVSSPLQISLRVKRLKTKRMGVINMVTKF